ncbi:Hypothetical predicted protein, partial [Marmota monax]
FPEKLQQDKGEALEVGTCVLLQMGATQLRKGCKPLPTGCHITMVQIIKLNNLDQQLCSRDHE